MTDSQENKMTMYQAVLALLASFSALWTGKAPLEAAKTWLENSLARVGLFRQIQEKDTKGITTSKKSTEVNLISSTLKVIDGLVPYATANSNSELLDSINYTPSDLKSSRDNILVDRSRFVYNAASPIARDLEPFNVAAADIAALNNLIGQYEIIMPAKRVSVTAQKVATASIKSEIKQIDQHLKNSLDNLMLMFRTSNSDFYDGYKASRIIVDLGKRKTGTAIIYAGTVFNFETMAPEAGVTVTIVETGKFVVTGADGSFSFTLPKAGIYTLKAEKPGFTTWNEDPTQFDAGSHIDIEIELEPLEV